jgi:hypothetical protein
MIPLKFPEVDVIKKDQLKAWTRMKVERSSIHGRVCSVLSFFGAVCSVQCAVSVCTLKREFGLVLPTVISVVLGTPLMFRLLFCTVVSIDVGAQFGVQRPQRGAL